MKITPKPHHQNLYVSSLIYNSKIFLKNKPIFQEQGSFRILRLRSKHTMFSDLRHQPPPPPHFAVTHHLVSTSEEADSKKESNTTNDDASIEVVRRPRGRPPGSKNKPRPPVFVTREPDTAMSPYVLEVSDGSDIVAAITGLCNHRTTGLCVLSGSGTVSNVSFQQPASTTTAITFHGRFDLLSISATILPSPVTTSSFGGSEGITGSITPKILENNCFTF